MRDHLVDACVEHICNKGCREVRKDITTMEQGGTPIGAEKLDDKQKTRVLAELKTIMSVYGTECRI
jgi:hypothetical protein